MLWHIDGSLVLWGETQLGRVGEVSVAAGEALPAKMRSAHWPLAPVPGGDYAAFTQSGIVGAERKRIDDLWASWRNARLARQLGTMLCEYNHVVLMVEDMPSYSFSDSLAVEDDATTLMQDLLTFQEQGIRVVFSRGLADTHRLLKVLVERYDRTVHHALDRQAPQDRYIYRRMLLAAPGWGSAAATEALRAIGTPIKVFTASQAELEAVKSVGAKKTHLLFGALGRRYGKLTVSWKRAFHRR